MNLLDLKVGDRVTLTALFDDEGVPVKKLVKHTEDRFFYSQNTFDTNIYAEKNQYTAGRGAGPVLLIQCLGHREGYEGLWYQYSASDLDYDFHTQSYLIKDIKIESRSYPLRSGWGAGTGGLYLVELFKRNLPFINWDKLPRGDKQ